MISREEFERELSEPGFYRRWDKKNRSELHRLFGGQAALLVDYQQNNPYHCYDLYHHTLKTVEYIANSARSEDHMALLIAAFFHDFGKPDCAVWKNGRKTFYGHPMHSAHIADRLLEQMGYSKAERNHICFYISNHDDFIQFVLPSEKDQYPDRPVVTEKSMRSLFRRLRRKYPEIEDEEWRQLVRHLPILIYADIAAQADLSVWHGVVLDSKEHKQEKVRLIREILLSLTEKTADLAE